jgi:glycosyltransferase involved in cell wall biosynthesis
MQENPGPPIEKKRILWLASWYPNRTSPFAGDFIQRQAIAVSRLRPLDLVFVTRDTAVPQHFSVHVPALHQHEPALSEYILYYPETAVSLFPFWSKIRSGWYYIHKHLALLKALRRQDGMPGIVHLQVAMRAGLIAYYLKKRYGIPYVITEHWTGYFNESLDPLRKKSRLFRFLLKKIFQEASCFLPVSANLGELVNRTVFPVRSKVIPNVVDISKFNTSAIREPERFRFIHVSSLNLLKNPQQIIAVFSRLIESGFDAELLIAGPAGEELSNITKGALQHRVSFTGEISYEQVALEMKRSSALVLFSRIENLPCVMLESLCCGVPVISSRVGGIAEVIHAGNGILVEPGNEQQLLDAMKDMMTGYARYDRMRIGREAQALYSYETVGRQIVEVYDEVLGNRNARSKG